MDIMQRFLTLACLSLLITLNSTAIAQSNHYQVELLTEKDGFSTSEIYSIAQDNNGFLWFGTADNGLMKYDGRKVTFYENDIDKKNSLSHNNAGNIFIDKNGVFWVGTWGGGVNRYQPKINQFQHFKYSQDAPHSISSNRIQSIHQDTQGDMWFGTYADGLNKLQKNGQDFEQFKHAEDRVTSLSNNRIWSIRNAHKDSLWIGTSFGLNLFNKISKSFKRFLPEPDNKGSGRNQIRHILAINKEYVLVGTKAGILHFNRSQNVFSEIVDQQQNSLGRIYSLQKDTKGNIWVGSNKGLFKLEPGFSKFRHISLPNEGPIRIIFQDKQGIIWATSEKYGIYKITPNKNFFELSDTRLTTPNELISDINGDLLIANAKSALFKIEKNTKKITLLNSSLFSSLNHKNEQIERNAKQIEDEFPLLHQTSASTLWYAQQNYLLKYDIESGIAQQIKKSNTQDTPLNELRALNSSQDGKIWIGSYKSGLHIYDPINNSFEHFMPNANDPYSLSHAEVLVIYRDKQNRMWVGTGKGLNLWDQQLDGFHHYQMVIGDSTRLFGNAVKSIFQSREGVIWIATKSGLYKLNEDSKKFQRVLAQNQKINGLIKSISDDQEGNLWLTTNKGISKFNPNNNHVINYDKGDGLLGVKYYDDAIAKTGDDYIYVSGPLGIDYFHPLQIKAQQNHVNVVLTGFQKMGSTALLDKPYPYVKEIKLAYHENFFSLEFAALDLYSPGKNKYAYKLEGFDKNWVHIGNKNTATYTNLDGGKYRFIVKTSNNDSEWMESDLAIDIIIASPPWKTWWAYSLYLVIILTAFVIFVRFKSRQDKKEINKQKLFVIELEKQVAMKTISLLEKTQALQDANLELKNLTYKDALSGLYNRRYFDKQLLKEISRHQRQQEGLTLVICDIDYFKRYNDHYGHIGGDKCLQKVSECLSNTVSRSSDSICRYGGEEFAIILPNTQQIQAIKIVKDIKSALAKLAIEHSKSPVNESITMSFGIYSIVPSDKTTATVMISEADEALYISKATGRNCYTIAGAKMDLAG